ncbi:glucose-6-phosphate isomerase [soil metagenome]
MATDTDWTRFNTHLCRYDDLGISLDISRMKFGAGFLDSKATDCERALAAMEALEAGEIANPDEGRMVGHYWLRDASLAPTKELRDEITRDLADVKSFAAQVHGGEIRAANGQKFNRVLLVGIGGSALGPQLVADCLVGPDAPMAISFFDNTDPDGMARVIAEIGDGLATTLTVVISKSGGTKETRNGMLAAEAAYTDAGISFPAHAVAVTGPGSQLDQHAGGQGWIKRFPMADWVGGRTSVMSVVGLVPAALQGVDLDAFLKGAADIDAKTRALPMRENAALLLALMWFSAGNGKGEKDMVVLPYKDRLVLFSKYLQQLVMESLGKERDLDGNLAHQGIAVYGNKGSTDQHAYVQQLRDGVNNFFATFIEVRESGGSGLMVEPDTTAGDYLQGFLRGTRTALAGSDRESMTISIPRADTYYLGMLIGLFERAVGFYASLVHINAYHQPGVEAGKKAATSFLETIATAKAALTADAQTADALAGANGLDPEDTYHALVHLAANSGAITHTAGASPAEDTFSTS